MAETPTTPPPKLRDLEDLEKSVAGKAEPLGDVVGEHIELIMAVTGERIRFDCSKAKTTAALRRSIAMYLNRPSAAIVFLNGCREIDDNEDVDGREGAVSVYVSEGRKFPCLNNQHKPMFVDAGPRDNGERHYVCANCGIDL